MTKRHYTTYRSYRRNAARLDRFGAHTKDMPRPLRRVLHALWLARRANGV